MKRSFRDVEHLARLVACFLAAFLAFAVARAALVPKDFGTYGHYRAGALMDVRSHPPRYAGRVRCAECHEDVIQTAAPSRHKNVSCEACHGPLLKHADDPEVAVAKPDRQADCMRCHSARTGRPLDFLNIDAEEHSGKDPCASCHKPHDPRPAEDDEPAVDEKPGGKK
jgi:hypothetical protein